MEDEPEVQDEQPLADGEDSAETSEQEPAPAGPDGFPLNTPVADMAAEQQAAYWRTQARKHEKAVKAYGQHSADQVRDMASRLQQIEDAQKSEQQLLSERLAAAEQRATQAEIGRARLLAAATHNIPPSLLDRIGGATEDEINDSAEAIAAEINAAVEAEIAKRLAAAPPPAPSTPAPTRPVEALTPGAMPASEEPEDGDSFLRRMAGRR